MLHKPEFVLENETHKNHSDFNIQTDHSVLARKPELMLINKKKMNCYVVDFTSAGGSSTENKSEKMKNISRELKPDIFS